MPKTIVIENDAEDLIPSDLRYVMEHQFTEDVDLWCWFGTAFHPENVAATEKRFSMLEAGGNIVCHHVFVDWQQLELMTLLMQKFCAAGKKINVYIMYNGLDETLDEYLNAYESDITPETQEYDDDPDLRERFKQDMNKLLLLMLEYHDVYELSRYENFTRLIKSDMLTYTASVTGNND